MVKKTPVLLMVYSLYDGGTERQVTEIAKWLDRSEFEPHVAAFKLGETLPRELERNHIPVLHLTMKSFLSPSYPGSLIQLRSYLRRHSIRLVHAFDPTTAISATFARPFLGIHKLLSSQRAYRDLTFPRYRPLLRVADRIVDGIVVNCEAMRTHLVEDEHARRSRIWVCGNAIDTNRFVPDARPRDSGKVTIGTACVLRPEKDLACLLQAFASVHSEYPQTELLIVGDGPEKPSLMQLAESLGVSHCCHFKGYHPNVEKWLVEMDIFVLPSSSEALSNSLMEAMACECTVVGSRVGGTPELIQAGQTGLLFECRDSAGLAAQLKRLIASPDMRRSLAQNARRLILHNYSTGSMIARMQEVYREVLWGSSISPGSSRGREPREKGGDSAELERDHQSSARQANA